MPSVIEVYELEPVQALSRRACDRLHTDRLKAIVVQLALSRTFTSLTRL